MFTIDGIVSGFDTGSIIESLLGFQQTQLDTFNARKAEITTQQTAFKGIEAQLLTVQNTLVKLNRTSNSVFDVQEAVSSDDSILTAAASSDAANGAYTLTVEQLATAHQIGSQGFDSISTEIATGELTLKVGDRPEQTVTIGPNNNTLAGLAKAINDEVEDVNAGIIYDQGSDSHRLVLTSKHTGAANEISVSGNYDAGSLPEVSFLGTPIQPAVDALIRLGQGSGAITASYSSNQVEDLIENVSLNLLKADPGSPVTVQVSSDYTSAKEAIGDFVTEFNAIIEFIDDQTLFVPETNQASPLLGNRSVNEIRDQLRQFAIDAVPGLAGGANRLSAIGVDINTQGRLQIDSAKLDKAFNGELEGIEPDEIRNLFGLNGTSNNVGVDYIAGSRRTVAADSHYEVNVTQVAEQAAITATNNLSGSTVITGTNNEFQITLDGAVSETLTLAEGTYTNEELSTAVQNAINSSADLLGRSVSVSVDESDNLRIVSDSYGSQSTISSFSGTAANILGFTGSESDEGQDVAGEFIIDGVTEPAIGNGRVLVGNSENEFSADLQVRVTLTSDQLGAGSEADIVVTRGVTGRLEQLLDGFLNTETGTLKGIDDAFEARIQDIDDSILSVEEITESKREFLIAEFTALESIISELRTTGDFLTAQLSSLSNNNRNNG